MAPFRILSVDIECQGRKVRGAEAWGADAVLAAGVVGWVSSGQGARMRAPPSTLHTHTRLHAHSAAPTHPPAVQGHFPEPQHDPVIQIASLVTEFGRSTPTVRNIMTLNSCSPITGAGASWGLAAGGSRGRGARRLPAPAILARLHPSPSPLHLTPHPAPAQR